MQERLILWQRWAAPGGVEMDAPEACLRGVESRLLAAGAELLLRIGGTFVASFDPTDLEVALNLVLETIAEAEAGADEAATRMGFGVALGPVSRAPDGWRGAAFDRAQALASRARASEIVLDPASAERAGHVFLLGRSVGLANLQGQAIDPERPLRRTCRMAIAKLSEAPMSPSSRASIETVLANVPAVGPQRLAIRSSVTAAASACIETLAREQTPAPVLRLSRQSGGLQPLGGLQVALQRLHQSTLPETLGPSGVSAEVLRRVREGAAVDRGDVVASLHTWLADITTSFHRPWIVVDGVHDIDSASLEVLHEALADVPVVFVALLSPDAPASRTLTRAAGYEELSLAPLQPVEACSVAEHMLGLERGSDVAMRVALIGGCTRLGVEEAARTLVAAGDLIHDGTKFGWRMGPRGGASAVPVDALLAERLTGLDAVTHRMLQVVCIAAHADDALLSELAAADGLDVTRQAASIERLRSEQLLTPAPTLEPAHALVRMAVRSTMPPGRAAELHRFAAQALVSRASVQHGFARAQLAFHLAEGGQESAAASALLEAAQGAHLAGFPRAALRLAAAAVQVDPSTTTKGAASALARAIGYRPPTSGRRSSSPPATTGAPPSAPSHGALDGRPNGRVTIPPRAPEDVQQLAESALQRAVEGIIAGDFDAVDRSIDMVLAAGRGRAAAERLRAVAYAARGDVASAMRTVGRLQAITQGQRTSTARPSAARTAVARALVLLHTGQRRAAVAAALHALSLCRSLTDSNGERAAMRTLASCYRALGREGQATEIEHAACCT